MVLAVRSKREWLYQYIYAACWAFNFEFLLHYTAATALCENCFKSLEIMNVVTKVTNLISVSALNK